MSTEGSLPEARTQARAPVVSKTPLLARKSVRQQVQRGVATFVILFGAVVILVPFWWMVRTSLMGMGEIFLVPIHWFPNPIVWSNYADAWQASTFTQATLNSCFVTFFATLGIVLSASVTAYGFARLRAPGRDFLFMLVLSSLMIPGIVVLVPTYLLFRALGWIDTYLPLIVPCWFGGGAFSIFLLRQFFRGIPKDLDEAATIDGAGYFRIYWNIIVPLSPQAHAAVAIFAFFAQWNDFFGPLIYLNSADKYTLPIELSVFVQAYNTVQWNQLMAVTLVAMLPCLVMFFVAQRYFVQGIAVTGVKG
jgi:multiple sugar transport system permease protein